MGLECFSILFILSIYIRKSKGPKTEPSGTPHYMSSIYEIVPFILIYYNMLDLITIQYIIK